VAHEGCSEPDRSNHAPNLKVWVNAPNNRKHSKQMKKLVATMAIALGLTAHAFSGMYVAGGTMGPTLPPGWIIVNVLPMLSNGNSTGWYEVVLYNPNTRQTALWWVAVY
jgi:hypothetical protein